MRLVTASALLGLAGTSGAAAEVDAPHRTKPGGCAIVVSGPPGARTFHCELDPSDAGGEAGAVRAIRGTPDQMASLVDMSEMGEIVSGKTLLRHQGAEVDGEYVFLPLGVAARKMVPGCRACGRTARAVAPGRALSLFERHVGRGKKKKADKKKDESKDFPPMAKDPPAKGEEDSAAALDDRVKKGYIIRFADDGEGPASKCLALTKKYGGEVGFVYYKALNGCSAKLTEAAASALGDDPSVAQVDEDGVVTLYANSWGLDRINQLDLPLDGVTTKVDASGVRVYVMDTGIRADHEDFAGMISEKLCHYSTVPEEPNPLEDLRGHGTHVASTACGITYGVAENCEICSLKVFGASGSSTFSRIIAAVDFAVSTCDGGLCVLNASLGGTRNPPFDSAWGNLVDSGVVTVVAAGNEADDACDYSPAYEPKAITVGATDDQDTPSWFTNWGPCVDVYAPGSDITAAYARSPTDTKAISGTSMSSPHVAGIAAYLLSSSPFKSPAEIKKEIQLAGTKPGIDSRTPGGVGLATIFRCDGCTRSPTLGPTERPTQSPTTPCTLGGLLEVDIVTDDFPDETSWELVNFCTGAPVAVGGPYEEEWTLYAYYLCAAPAAYTFTLYDSWGDGISVPGRYEVRYEGVVEAAGGRFDDVVTKTFGDYVDCTAEPTGTFTQRPYTPYPSYTPTSEDPTLKPTEPRPTEIPTTMSPTDECYSGGLVEMEILTDSYPEQTTWSLKDLCMDDTAASGGPYGISDNTYRVRLCAPPAAYLFTLSERGTYKVRYEGTVEGSGAAYGSPVSFTFGSPDHIDCTLSPTQSPTACLKGGQVEINLKTDKHPEETSWELINSFTGDRVASAGPFNIAEYMYTYVHCAEPANWAFMIYDSRGDGMDGSYTLSYNDEVMVSGGGPGYFTSSKMHLFGGFQTCAAMLPGNPTAMPAPTPAPTPCTLAGKGESCVDDEDCCSGRCSGGKLRNRVCLATGRRGSSSTSSKASKSNSSSSSSSSKSLKSSKGSKSSKSAKAGTASIMSVQMSM